jgi:quinohemoprotein amine dehydrogenase beta subunit
MRSVIGLKAWPIALWVLCAGAATPSFAKEYILVGSYGNKLYLIDPVAAKIAHTFQVPGAGTGPSYIAPSPDGRVAYVVTNRFNSVSGIDLDSGKEVFRADLAQGDVRVHAMFGLDVSPDGKWLYVVEQRYKLLSDRFEVVDPVIAVYRTDAGAEAKPARLMPIKHQIQHLAVSTDGKTIYAHGLDLYAIDAATGKLRDTMSVANWKRDGYGPAEAFAWLGEQLNSSGVYAMDFYTDRLGQGSPDSPARDLGVLSANLKTGAMTMEIIGPASEAPDLTGMTVNPRNPNEVIGIGGSLVKIDRRAKRVIARAPTNGLLFYMGVVSADGQRVYTGGGHCRVGIYATKDLSPLGLVELPNCAVMGMSSVRIVNRP